MLDKSTGGVAAAYGMGEEKDGVDVLHKYAEAVSYTHLTLPTNREV